MSNREIEEFRNETPNVEEGTGHLEHSQSKTRAVAIKVSNVWYKHRKTVILQNMNMTIMEGKIYGILGPSGCGKTTLLRCVVGLLKPTDGQILVFGATPASKNSIVPGPDVGYMPQEVALYAEFTVKEALEYFGRLCGLNSKTMQQRKAFLSKFLELPPWTRRVGKLSGGEKRRVSLAAALIQDPTLLVLDEPTVGLDPILRESIWKHLLELSEQKKLTIIITTHYVEETRRAGTIAFLRQGTVLAEENPEVLLSLFSTRSLEVVFLKFCKGEASTSALYQNRPKDNVDNVPFGVRKKTTFGCQRVKTTVALVKKGAIRIRRNIPDLVVQVLLPGFQMLLFCLCFGNQPRNLKIAVDDQDGNYSKEFMKYFNKDYIDLREYEDFDAGYYSVLHGKTWGLLHFSEYYTQSVRNRLFILDRLSELRPLLESNPLLIFDVEQLKQLIEKYLNEDMWNAFSDTNATAQFYGDYSNFPMKAILMRQMTNVTDHYLRYFLFGHVQMILHNEDDLEKINETHLPPLVESVPVYGSTDLEDGFRDFAVPGVLMSETFMLAASLTALAFVIERREGTLERTMIAGVRSYQFILSHIILQFSVVLFQAVAVLLSAFVIFKTTIHGNWLLVAVITVLQGVVGMSFGLLVSSLCRDEIAALTIVVGIHIPTIVISAVFWPHEAMPKYMQWISYAFPQTLPTKALRFVILRGWGLTKFTVWFSIVWVLIWILAYNGMAVFFFSKV